MTRQSLGIADGGWGGGGGGFFVSSLVERRRVSPISGVDGVRVANLGGVLSLACDATDDDLMPLSLRPRKHQGKPWIPRDRAMAVLVHRPPLEGIAYLVVNYAVCLLSSLANNVIFLQPVATCHYTMLFKYITRHCTMAASCLIYFPSDTNLTGEVRLRDARLLL